MDKTILFLLIFQLYPLKINIHMFICIFACLQEFRNVLGTGKFRDQAETCLLFQLTPGGCIDLPYRGTAFCNNVFLDVSAWVHPRMPWKWSGMATVVIMNCLEQLKSICCADNWVSSTGFICGFLSCSETILVQMYWSVCGLKAVAHGKFSLWKCGFDCSSHISFQEHSALGSQQWRGDWIPITQML